MSVLVEDVRSLMDEQNQALVDATEYSTSSTSMVTLRNYGNVTLAKAGLLVFQFQIKTANVGPAFVRLKVGNFYVFAATSTSTTYANKAGMVYLPAGTYAVLLEGSNPSGYTTYAHLFECGVAVFSDLAGEAPLAYVNQLSETVANRTTCVGALKNAVFMVQVACHTPSEVTNMENVGDNLTNGVALTVDGAQVSWGTRFNDTSITGYGEAYGLYSCVLSVDSAHTFAISLRDANTVVHINIVGCPWLLPSSAVTNYEPVALNFSQQSTVYINLAPLMVDETKTLNLGKKRAISFGAATDYFSTSTGTGLVSWNYTFSLVQMGDCQLFIYGTTYGSTCIEMIGVDAR